MNESRWHRIKAIFSAAVSLPEDSWETYVTDACSGDSALRDEILSLLRADRFPHEIFDAQGTGEACRVAGSKSPHDENVDVIGPSMIDRRLSSIFHAALALDSSARASFLDVSCADHPSVRKEIESLLAAYEEAPDFLDVGPNLTIRVNDGLDIPSADAPSTEGGRRPSLPPGSRLGERYRVERLLGRGGMGEVYEAYDNDLMISIALKTLRPELTRDAHALSRLKLEVLLARLVTDPHVCRIYDAGHAGEGDDAVWFLSMELLHGETLRQRLRRIGRLSTNEALPLVVHMTRGLSAAHRAGVVHRDLKSANVMIVSGTDGERAVVTDFGVARAAPLLSIAICLQDSGTLVAGTPAYMAPEQIRGEEVGSAADIYSLGIVLFEMVTGRLPFVGVTPEHAGIRRLIEDPPSPRSFVPVLDERWEAVILRCLARDPLDRFTRVEDVVTALTNEIHSTASFLMGSLANDSKRERHSLPAERDSFVGRDQDLTDLASGIMKSRLVTLLGTAGMGKTRLALHYGWQHLDDWPGGVWFCDLTEARSVNGIASVVAASLATPLGKDDPAQQLGHAIAGRGRCLIILDNFEQVVRYAEATVGQWLDRAHNAHFVVTSRQRLSLRGEGSYQVEPLELKSGTALFMERARLQRPHLEREESVPESVQEIVSRAEGMPLAIELAAARARIMTIPEIAKRLRERLPMLAAGGEGRHGSLQAAIDASWELLQPWERAAWVQCSVFEGGFTLEAAESVLDLSSWSEAPWVVDVVQSLVDKSLLRVWVPAADEVAVASHTRFRMYATLQEYARQSVAVEGSLTPEASAKSSLHGALERHGRWFARFGSQNAIEGIDRSDGMNRRRLRFELENLVAACRWAVGQKDGTTAAATYRAAEAVFESQGPYGAGLELGQQVLTLPLGPEPRCDVFDAVGRIESRLGLTENARARFEAALIISQQLADRHREGRILGNLGFMSINVGQTKIACNYYGASLAIARQLGNRGSEAATLCNLGQLLSLTGATEAAIHHFELALVITREISNRALEGVILGNLGLQYLDRGGTEEARTCLESALTLARRVGDRRTESFALTGLGNLEQVLGQMDRADAAYRAALGLVRELGDRVYEGIILGSLGSLHYERGLLGESVAFYQESLALHVETRNRPYEGMVVGNLARVYLEQGSKNLARSCFESALAIHEEVGHARLQADALVGLGELHRDLGELETAMEALGRGEAILRRLGESVELGNLLCTRADMSRGTGAMETAVTDFREAETIAGRLDVAADSRLGRNLARLRQSLSLI